MIIMLLENFGIHLLAARVNNGFTQQQLAQAANIHQSIVSAMENGRRLPTLPQLLQLAGVMKVPLQWFLTGSNMVGRELPDLAFHLQQLGIADLHVENARVPGAFQSTEETIALAMAGNAPPARIIEAMPAVLAWNAKSPFGLLNFAGLYDIRIKYRLGWLADIALTIHEGQGFPGGCRSVWCLEHLVRDVGLPEEEDSLGFADHGDQRPPVTLRWKMGYPTPLASFRERAERLHALRADKMFRSSSES